MKVCVQVLLIVTLISGCQKQEAEKLQDKAAAETSEQKHQKLLQQELERIPKHEEVKKVNTEFLAENFDHNIDSLPEGFKGHDPNAIFGALQDLTEVKKVFEQGKYETKSEHETRIAEELKKNLNGKINFGTQMAFVMDTKPQYDPDKKLLKFYEFVLSIYSGKNELKKFRLTEKEQVLGQDTRSNAFGATANVTTIVKNRINLVIFGKKMPVDSFIEWQISMPIPQAKELDQHKIALLFYGKLRKPYYTNEFDRSEPTISEPSETIRHTSNLHFDTKGIWLIDRTTGRILTKDVTFKKARVGI